MADIIKKLRINGRSYDLAGVGETGDGDSHIEITQAEYDNLSEEEKNDGTVWFIKDSTEPNLDDIQQTVNINTEAIASLQNKAPIFEAELLLREEAETGLVNAISFTVPSEYNFYIGYLEKATGECMCHITFPYQLASNKHYMYPAGQSVADNSAYVTLNETGRHFTSVNNTGYNVMLYGIRYK